jgi:hypothetical protein
MGQTLVPELRLRAAAEYRCRKCPGDVGYQSILRNPLLWQAFAIAATNAPESRDRNVAWDSFIWRAAGP